jgi:non-specific serine/threonine protein kinase
MLETIRAFAAERLEELGEVDELRRRHAGYYRDLAHQQDERIRAGEPEEIPVAVLEREIHNLRAAVELGLEAGEVELVRAITVTLTMYWKLRGLYAEARLWLDRALALSDIEDDTRRRLLSSLGFIAYVRGDLAVAKAASERAASLAAELGGATDRLDLLREQGWAAIREGDLGTADMLFRERLDLALEVDNGVAISSCRLNLATIARLQGKYQLADELLSDNLAFTRSRGQVTCETVTLASRAELVARHLGRPEDSGEDALRASELALGLNDTPTLVYGLDLVALSVAAGGDAHAALLILAATEAARGEMGVAPDEDEEAIRSAARDLAGGGRASDDGGAVDLEAAVDLARTSVVIADPVAS